MEENNLTIVSAFMSNVTKPEWTEKSYKKYTEFFIPLLQSNVNKIIFIDSTLTEQYKSYENLNTKIIPFVKESNYLYKLKDKITNFQTNNNNPEKDTIEYMFTMCYKTEWVKLAIELDNNQNPNSQYMWIDFGIKHMCNCTNEEFIQKIEKLKYLNYEHVRIGSIWNLDANYNINPYINILWYFAGGVLGGNKLSLLEFAKVMKEICLEIIDNQQTIMWEVNIWYLLYKKNSALFSPYYCEHNLSIIENY